MGKQEYLPRIIDAELSELLEALGAVLIEGPKWCGKTRTATERAASSLLVSRNRALAHDLPEVAL